MDSIKLIKGEKYILRNGEITEPMQQQENGTNYKFFTISKEGYFNNWLQNGRFLSINIEHAKDIIKQF